MSFVPVNPTLLVAVIDTGITNLNHPGICASGHEDFTGEGLADRIGHGTMMSSLIHQYADTRSYCQIILKFYKEEVGDQGVNNVLRLVAALKKAALLKVDVVNISAGGPSASKEEFNAIQQLLRMGVKVVTAAGNDNMDLTKDCYYFPACYDRRIIVVGCKQEDGTKCRESNYGTPVDIVETGIVRRGGRVISSGTSLSAAVITGKIARELTK